MVSEKVTIVNPSGLHLLNAVNLSNSVSRYKSAMSFTYENNGMQGTVNLKSILSIVAAGIRQGDTIEICSSGEDEEEALRAAIAAIKSGSERRRKNKENKNIKGKKNLFLGELKEKPDSTTKKEVFFKYAFGKAAGRRFRGHIDRRVSQTGGISRKKCLHSE